jgi:apolipoprotein D and lipocalin family protein
MNRVLAVLVCLSGAACTAHKALPPPETVPWVDLTRYQGTWYEIARLPMWFQRGCVTSMATYGFLEPGRISVLNECVTAGGERKAASGYASVVDTQSNAKLEVVFDTWLSRLFPSLVKGKYWIFFVDPEYQTAIVGTPDREYLWILSRMPIMDEEQYRRLVEQCRALGFDTERLIRAGA